MKYACRLCPVCGDTERSPLHVQQFAELSEGALLPGYDVVVCRGCGFGFADGIPPQADFDAYYRDMSKYVHEERGGGDPPGDLARLEKTAAMIHRTMSSVSLRILDVGCSTGGLLAILKRTGYRNLQGLDPSPACAVAARKLYDIEVITASLGNFDPAPAGYDLIVLAAVLEHIHDLQPALAHLRNMLSEQGCLFLSVPDAGRFSQDEDAPFQQFSIEHINYFSSLSLQNLLNAAGFEQVCCEQNSYPGAAGGNTSTPVLDTIFRKTEIQAPSRRPDDVTERELRRYIEKSRTIDVRIRRVIDEIIDRGDPILVWGTGAHTRRLLATSRLAQARIIAFVDSNPRYQGKQLSGVPVISPQEVASRPEPILISSQGYQQEIATQIRHSLKLPNPLLLLYS